MRDEISFKLQLCGSGSGLDSDPYLSNFVGPDPHTIYQNPHHCKIGDMNGMELNCSEDGDTFVQKLTAKIFENLQVTLRKQLIERVSILSFSVV